MAELLKMFLFLVFFLISIRIYVVAHILVIETFIKKLKWVYE